MTLVLGYHGLYRCAAQSAACHVVRIRIFIVKYKEIQNCINLKLLIYCLRLSVVADDDAMSSSSLPLVRSQVTVEAYP